MDLSKSLKRSVLFKYINQESSHVAMIAKKSKNGNHVIILYDTDLKQHDIRDFPDNLVANLDEGDFVSIIYKNNGPGTIICTFSKIENLEKDKSDYLYKVCKEGGYLRAIRDKKIKNILK